MKNVFFAALAALALGIAVLPAYAASTIGGSRSGTIFHQNGAAAGDGGAGG